jgi:hypothetical protein
MNSARVTKIALVLALSASALSAQTIRIKLVDGRNGRPKARSHVNVWIGKERKSTIVIPTDKDGVASLVLTEREDEVNVPRVQGDESLVLTNPVVKYDDDLRINVPFVLCQSGGPNYSWLAFKHFSTKQVIQQGTVTPNTCGKATASPEPGDLIVFVRPLTWWEKMKQ